MSDEVFYIGDGRGPVKTSSESFVNQVSRGHVIAVGTRVDFEKQLHSLFLGDAFLQYPFLDTFPHQVVIHQHVMLAAMDGAFSFDLIGGYIGASEVLDELFPPYGRRRYCKYQLLGGVGLS